MINIILNVQFFCSQDVADSDSSGEKSVLYLLLKMFVSSSSSHLKTSTRSLILKVRGFFFYFLLSCVGQPPQHIQNAQISTKIL